MSAKHLASLALAAIVLGLSSASPMVFHRLSDYHTKSLRRFGDDSECVYGFYGHNCGSGIDFGFVGNLIDAFSNGRSDLRLFFALLAPTTTLVPAYEINPRPSAHGYAQRRWKIQAG